MTSPTPTLDDLLVHEAFLRRIARAILADDESARDAVQETWLRAVRTPPRDPTRQRAWLAVVVSNVAKSLRQRTAVRQRALAADLAPEASGAPEPAAILERERVRKRVVDAVLGLEAKARDAILLMYFEGVSPALAAERLGIPLNTFLSRVHRARIELKRRLLDEAEDREHTTRVLGGLAAWRRPLAGQGLRVAAIAIGAATLSASAVFLLTREPANPPVTPAAVQSAVAPTPPAPVEPQPASTNVPAPRSEVAETFDVKGVVRDSSGLLLADARVSALTARGKIETLSRDDGTFVLPLPQPATVEVVIESPRHLGTRLQASPADTLDVVLLRGVPLRGFARDSASGRSIRDARITIDSLPGQPPVVVANSDATGAFAFMAPARPLEITIAKVGYDSARRIAFEPRPDAVEIFDLAPARSDARAFVRLLDLAGKPLASVDSPLAPPRALGGGVFEIALEATEARAYASSLAGAKSGNDASPFPQIPVSRKRRTMLSRGRDGVPLSIVLDAEEGIEASAPVELRLPGRASIAGVVRDSKGSVVAGVTVVAERQAGPPGKLTPLVPGRVETVTGAQGDFRFDALPEAANYRLVASVASGYTRVSEPVTATSTPQAIDIVLDPGSKIGGRVVDAGGEPVCGARLTLRPARAQPAPAFPGGSAPVTSSVVVDELSAARRVGFTDAEGRFEIEHVTSEARIEVDAIGHASLRELDLGTVRAAALAGELTLALPEEQVLIGKVVSKAGLPLAGARVTGKHTVSTGKGASFTVFGTASFAVSGTRADGSLVEAGPNESGRFDTISRSDGTFELRGLPSGSYALTAEHGAGASEVDFTPFEAQPRDCATPHTIEIVRRCTVYGRAVDSTSGRVLTDYAQSITGNESTSIALSTGIGSDVFQHILGEGDRVDLRLETGRGDTLTARALDAGLGSSREIVFELPDSRAKSERSGTLELEAALPGAKGVRVVLIPDAPNPAPIRCGLVGVPSLSASLNLPAGKYRVTLHDAADTQFYCDPEVFEIQPGGVHRIGLKAR